MNALALSLSFTLFRFVATLPLYAYAISLIALNAATLCATTTFPRKARRDPIFAHEYDASLLALAYDTPPKRIRVVVAAIDHTAC